MQRRWLDRYIGIWLTVCVLMVYAELAFRPREDALAAALLLSICLFALTFPFLFTCLLLLLVSKRPTTVHITCGSFVAITILAFAIAWLRL